MKKEINKPVTIATIIAIIIVGYLLFHKEYTWQGVYYPNGCLTCEDDYIFSPIYKAKESCLIWAENMKLERNNENDLYECGKNCKWKEGFSVCEETFGEEGTGIHY